MIRNTYLLVLLFIVCSYSGYAQQYSISFKGLSIVAPKIDVGNQPYCELKESAANAVAIIPFGFSRVGSNQVNYNYINWQWWGETLKGAEQSIIYAHEEGLKVMLKPQIYIPGSWPGALDLPEKDWLKWEQSYRKFILDFAAIAERQHVDLLCIGTELDISAVKRPAFWNGLIKDIRKRYSGKLCYAANWDKFDQISFWSELDFIGIDAYFPLLDKKDASIKDLKKAWEFHLASIETTKENFQKPILFTEFGYLSVDNCAFENWTLQSQRQSLSANEEAQAIAFEALFQTFVQKEWWAGGFIWKWYIDEGTKERRPETDYTPQAKKAFYTIKDWYHAN